MNSQARQFPFFLVFLLIIIALVNGFADANHWYWEMRWLDMPMHFSGGVWLAGFGVWWKYTRFEVPIQKFSSLLGVCLAFTLSIGLLWEAYEAIVGLATVGHMNEMQDTLGDLLFDILGGTSVAGLVWWKRN